MTHTYTQRGQVASLRSHSLLEGRLRSKLSPSPRLCAFNLETHHLAECIASCVMMDISTIISTKQVNMRLTLLLAGW